MLPEIGAIAAFVHFSALGALALYGLHRIWLLVQWRSLRQSGNSTLPPLLASSPSVTVQLPVYNERFVAQRLVDAVAGLDWPADKLEIQVLDDSTDDTTDILGRRVAYWQGRGLRMHHIHRSHRNGFKAGALAEGLHCCEGEFVAIFDADFIPAPDFLKKTLPHFHEPKIGMVQTRWTFCNTEHSWLTGVQALLLGPHFSIEHQVRYRKGLFFNFNGTAGIWRRQAIIAAGGWQADTVTEDLDLSYRAQLAGWRFVYLDDYEVPSELPATIAALRSQQQRWAKGSVQTARKILPLLLAWDLPFKVKREAMTHLLANVCWLLGTIIFLTLYPTIVFRAGIGPLQMMRLDLPLFIATSCAIMSYFGLYLISSRIQGSIRRFFLLPVVGIGLAPGVALAVLRGLWGSGGFFERTPKFGVTGKGVLPEHAFLYRQKEVPHLLLNSFLLLYSLLPLIFAWQHEIWYALPFFFLFPTGFLAVILQEIHEILNGFRLMPRKA